MFVATVWDHQYLFFWRCLCVLVLELRDKDGVIRITAASSFEATVTHRWNLHLGVPGTYFLLPQSNMQRPGAIVRGHLRLKTLAWVSVCGRYLASTPRT